MVHMGTHLLSSVLCAKHICHHIWWFLLCFGDCLSLNTICSAFLTVLCLCLLSWVQWKQFSYSGKFNDP